MRKAYDLVGWHHLRASLWHIKICERFIRFFGGIHKDKGKIFSPLLWRIFYDPLLCEVKRHKQLCEYWINTKFVSKSGRIESGGGLTLYFLAGAFVDNMISVGNCQASTQYALNIASEFFVINDIFINNEKMVAIPINQGVKVASLSICSIFLSAERLSKPSVAKAYVDVRFFVNVVLRKAITDKQFSYLVSAVLQPIVSYHIQFSFVSFNVCRKSKACLPCNFPDAALHHPSLYGLKPFEQVQSEGKITALIMFSNAFGILRRLFRHRFLDLQVLGWASLDSLQFPVRLRVSPVNNFLAEMVKIFLDNELSLMNNLPTAFHSLSHFPLSSILGKSLYFDSVKSLRCFGITFGDWLFDKKGVLLDWKTFCHWKRLDPCSPVPHWFLVSFEFLKSQSCSFSGSIGSAEKLGLDILESGEFSAVKDKLHDIWSGFFEVFTDGSLRNADSAEVTCSAVAYFLVLDKSIGIIVSGLLSSTIAELQAVALALECVPSSSTVVLRLDSQAAIDACVSEMSLRCHIFNLVRNKDLSVSWVKVKGHSGIPGNVEADLAAGAASGSPFSFCANVREHFLVAEGVVVSGNAQIGPGYDVVPDAIIGCIDWVFTAKVWHLDSYMLTGFTSWVFSMLRIYYEDCAQKIASGGKEKIFSDHTFTCVHESDVRGKILAEASARWSALAGGSPASAVLKVAATQIVDYVKFVVELHHAKVWLARASHRVVMEKAGLVCDGGVVSGLSRGVSSVLFDDVVRLLGVANFFAISFGRRKSYCFFSGLGGSMQIIIGV
ncbi:hypothetical protein G9A89_003449 [Geosiphon pyriformis]|nr:hypothetical protein G9A89_003449 [Geosiphon pyriformis]